jgi:hypothetical protein
VTYPLGSILSGFLRRKWILVRGRSAADRPGQSEPVARKPGAFTL